MHTWPTPDAAARFDECLDACLVQGPQMITRYGAEVAVLVPVGEWRSPIKPIDVKKFVELIEGA